MDKASRAIRRSGVKLLSMGGGHSDLNVLVCDIKDVKNSAKTFMNAQHLAAQDMMRWASHEENRAVKDVVSNIADLFLVWTEVQNTFLSHLKEYRQLFEMILEGEKQVAQAKDNLEYCVEKEAKVRKEMKKVAKRASAGELRILQARVEQAEQAKDLAQVELSDRVRENEAIKLIRMKEGLLKISGAYIAMACQCNTIFTAQRNIALQLPDVHGRELETIKYSGAETTKFIVEKARSKVESYSSSDMSSDPPPPYTPPDAARGRSSSSARISEQAGQPDARPRYSLTSNPPLTGSGSRASLETDYLPRSRSNSNRSETNSTSNSCLPHRTSSNTSLSRGVQDANVIAQSGSSRSSSPVIPHTDNSQTEMPTNQSPVQTIVHTNVVTIKHATIEPSIAVETNLTTATDGTNVKSVPDDFLSCINNDGRPDNLRQPTENTCNLSNTDNIQYVDDDRGMVADMGSNLRPRPAPRRRSNQPDCNDDYDTAEEEQGDNSG